MITNQTRHEWRIWRKNMTDTGRTPRIYVCDGQIRTDHPSEYDTDITVLFFAWLDKHITDEVFERLVCEYVQPIPAARVSRL